MLKINVGVMEMTEIIVVVEVKVVGAIVFAAIAVTVVMLVDEKVVVVFDR